jgi:hypothetical protein
MYLDKTASFLLLKQMMQGVGGSFKLECVGK